MGPSKAARPYWHLDFRHLVSITLREQICCFKPPHLLQHNTKQPFSQRPITLELLTTNLFFLPKIPVYLGLITSPQLLSTVANVTFSSKSKLSLKLSKYVKFLYIFQIVLLHLLISHEVMLKSSTLSVDLSRFHNEYTWFSLFRIYSVHRAQIHDCSISWVGCSY